MTIITRSSGVVVPLREQRTASGTLAALNAVVDLPINGDESAIIQVNAGAAVTGTIAFEFSADGGVNYYPLLAMPYYALTGTIPVGSQTLIVEAFSAVIPTRVYAVACGGFTNIRVRQSLWTSGTLTVRINSGPEFSVHPNMFARASTLHVTATGAASAAVTATLPAVTGLRHYIDRITITRSCSVAIAAANAAPIIVTTTNLPGSPAFTFGQKILAVGDDTEVVFDAGATGLAASAIGVATTVVAPVYTSVIWRLNVTYRLGL